MKKFCLLAILAGLALGQRVFRYNQPEATTARYDAQRTGWVRRDHFITSDKVTTLALQWKTKLENTAVNGAALGSGIVTSGGLGITLAYLGASDNRTVAVDMDNGYPFFNRRYSGTAAAGTGSCLSASLATPARSTSLAPAIAGDPTPAGQATTGPNAQLPYGSILGAPGEGIPPVKPGAYYAQQNSYSAPPGAKPYDGTPQSSAQSAAFVAAAGPAAGRGFGPPPTEPQAGRGPAAAPVAGRGPGRGMAGGGRGAFGGPGTATYAISNDGALHALTTTDGLDGLQPMPFLPAGAQASDLVFVEGVIFATTQNGCGGAPNGLWAIRPAATPAGGRFPEVRSWKTGGTASPHGPAFNEDGVLFVAVGSGTGEFADSVLSLDRATFAVKAQFKQAGADFTSSPVIFRVDNRDVVAVQRHDGQVILLDGSSLGSAPLAASAPGSKSPGFTPRGLAAWQDDASQWWLAAPTSTSVVAWKVGVNGKSITLTEGWKLANLQAPLAPLVINNLVFVLSSGDSTAKRSPAVLYALDGVSGKALWTSGRSITTHVPRSSAIWNSMGQVLVGAADSTLYAFGMTMDRHL